VYLPPLAKPSNTSETWSTSKITLLVNPFWMTSSRYQAYLRREDAEWPIRGLNALESA
jgi:hypothetical protein